MFEKVLNPLFKLETYQQVRDGSWTDDEGNPVEAPDMSDTFYERQKRATGSAVGSKSHPAKPKKITKADVIANMPAGTPNIGFDKLVMADLQTLSEYQRNPSRLFSHVKPVENTRTKQPWVDCMKQVTGLEIDWAKLTIADIKAYYAHLTQGVS